MRVRRVPILLLSLPALVGCHAYRAGTPEDLRTGTEVRARLSPGEAGRLESLVAPRNRALEGRIEEVDPDSVLLRVTVHNELRGARVQTLQQRVRVARSGILDMEVREMDRFRTGILVGGAVAVLTAVAIDRWGGGGEGGDDPGPPPAEARIPLLRVFIGGR